MVTYCKNEAQANAEMAEWLKTAVGKSMPNQFGNQCTAAMQWYSVALFGRPWVETLRMGNAIDHIDNANTAYFTKIWNNPNDPNLLPRAGDIAVYRGAAPLWDGRYYGHTGSVDSFNASTQTLVQQDGAAPPTRRFPDGYNYSVKPAHKSTFLYIGDPSVGDVRGWLRPKWQKVVYTGADTRGYGTVTTAPQRPSGPVQKPVAVKRYTLETGRRTGFHMPRADYGFGSKIQGVTIHHWGSDGQNFDSVTRFLCDTTSADRKANPTSAHYVVQDGRVAQLADDSVATYHAGSAKGNGVTIGIECRPEMTAGDLDTLAQLIADLEGKHGPLKVYVHKEWFATACPGRYAAKVPWIVARVGELKAGRGAAASGQTVTTTKKNTLEELMTMSQADFNREKKIAGTPAWTLVNDRDRGVNIEKRLKHVEWAATNDRDRGLNTEKRIIAMEKKLDTILAKLEGK